MTELEIWDGVERVCVPPPAAPLLLLRGAPSLREVAAEALDEGLRRVEVLAWRDLEDAEAGGSELHVHEIARRWGAAGLDVTVRTSAVRGAAAAVWRDGYRVRRRGGRYAVFPAAAWRALGEAATSRWPGRHGAPDGLVEVWNGMPFFSPLWQRRARVVFLHHVHGEMWRMVLGDRVGRCGEWLERRLAPPVYRRTRVVTLSESSRREIRQVLGLQRVDVVPPGVDRRFVPGAGRSPVPMVLAVGRLAPVKRFPMLVGVLAEVKKRIPGLRVVIAGEGYHRPEVEAAIRGAGARAWIDLPGRCSADDLVALYRRAWVLASASQREGWGMTITEAAACATPAMVSDIAGHRDAVIDGVTGLLASTQEELALGLSWMLEDGVLRRRFGRAAAARAGGLSWEATAAGTLRVLLDEHRKRPVAGAGPGGRASRPRPTPTPSR